MEDETPLERAVKAAENQAALAAIVGVTQQAISLRLKSGKPMPAEWVVKVEASLGIPRHEMRPDLYPPPSKRAA